MLLRVAHNLPLLQQLSMLLHCIGSMSQRWAQQPCYMLRHNTACAYERFGWILITIFLILTNSIYL